MWFMNKKIAALKTDDSFYIYNNKPKDNRCSSDNRKYAR